MATNKNFEIKNGLTIAGTERISSDGAFTGSLASATTATTQSAADSSTKIATTAYTDAAITAVIGGAPGTLDTLNELAAAINDDASYASTLTTALATKLPLAGGTLTGDLNFGDNDKAVFGAGSDLQIYHSGGSSFIDEVGVGDLYIRATSKIELKSHNGAETYAQFNANGSARLFYDNAEKLATTATGIDVTGTATMDGLTVSGSSTGTLNVVNFLNTDTSANQTANRLGLGISNSSAANYTYIEAKETGIDAYADMNFYTGVTATKRMTLGVYGDISFYEDTGTTAKFFWDASAESLGIGTTSPESLVHIKAADSVTGVIKIEGGKNTVTSIGEINSQLDFGSNDPSVNNTGNIGGRIASVTENQNGAYTGMAFYTFTQSESPDLSEKVRITNDGNVGIGTSNPTAPLHVDTNTDNAYGIRLTGRTDNGSGVWTGIGIGGEIANTKSAIIFEDIGQSYSRGKLLFCVNNDEDQSSADPGDARLTIQNDGNVGIGTTSPAKSLHIKTPSATPATLRLDTGGAGSDVWDVYSSTAGRLYINAPAYGAGVYIQHSATSWTSNSDETLKENITSLGTVGDKLKNYRTSYFNWINDQRETPKRQIGFIAQDWETDFPEVVNKVEGEPLGMQYTETIPILLKYIQELEARIETLENA